MRRLIAILALAGGLAGCMDQVAPAPPSSVPPPPVENRPDTCGAAALQYLVGHPVADIPQTTGQHEQRVIAETAIRDHHVDPARRTILYDAKADRITRVTCE